jgi:hypothetical protein
VKPLTLVILESPFRATPYFTEAQHRLYLDHCIADCIVNHGEAPLASHKLYTDSLDDEDPLQRELGISAGLAWGQHAAHVAVYADFGISPGMSVAIDHYKKIGKAVYWRTLDYRLVKSLKEENDGAI